MSTLATLQQKYGADQKRLARAFALLAADQKLSAEKIDEQLQAEDAKSTETPPAKTEAAAKPADTAIVFSTLVEKFSGTPDRLQRALGVLAAHSDFSVEQVEQQLADDDAAELKQLRQDLAAMKARAEKAEGDFAALKNSGHLGVKLGAGANGGAAPGTEQKELKGLSRVKAAFAAAPINQRN